ncbi:carboxypeptidase-like regulatory domain-containing protein [Hymenobacter sp. HDW8]|uniref:carboxypeptidase-like regulatory domain-containing protein n=1 Tax=Hymenobacter sp. HDW8 TaxID=2714932 RepID=UPI00140B0E38|nr:carboxypeptidase-like regulatory domain-containing protein [Hymenobacter sp. HDW8]QIL75261.1 carboxypeptidase regulatory-like domain-containing protein [Hymenobacter sp. HDW8]
MRTNSTLFVARILLVLLAWLIAATATAQTPGSLTGTVRTSASAPIDYATITLHRAADSSVVKTEFSDAQGAFRFEGLSEGSYRVSAAQLGYVRHWSAPFTLPAGGKFCLLLRCKKAPLRS